MKRILGCILAVALMLGMMSTTAFAEDTQSDQPVQSQKANLAKGAITCQVSVSSSEGGTVTEIGSTTCLCTWTSRSFNANPLPGYQFVGWGTNVSWESYEKVGEGRWGIPKYDWVKKNNPTYSGAFSTSVIPNGGSQLTVNHVKCGLEIGIRNVSYSAVAQFEKLPAPATIKVNHIGIIKYTDDTEKSRGPLEASEIKMGYLENQVVAITDLKKEFAGYTFNPGDVDSITLKPGENAVDINYVKDERAHINEPATLTVNHVGKVLNQKGDAIKVIQLGTDPVKDAKENDKIKLADLARGFGDYTFDTTKNVQEKTLGVGPNTIEVIYTRGARIVPVTVNYVGVTLNSAGTEIGTRKPLGTDSIPETYREGDIIKSGQVKKVDTLEYFKYDSTRDETIQLPFYPDNAPPVPTSDAVAARVAEVPVRTSINVYYVYKQSPYIPPVNPPVTIVEETVPLKPTPAIETIKEDTVPLVAPSTPPQTGDTTPFVPLLALVALAGTVLGVTKIKLRKAK